MTRCVTANLRCTVLCCAVLLFAVICLCGVACMPSLRQHVCYLRERTTHDYISLLCHVILPQPPHFNRLFAPILTASSDSLPSRWAVSSSSASWKPPRRNSITQPLGKIQPNPLCPTLSYSTLSCPVISVVFMAMLRSDYVPALAVLPLSCDENYMTVWCSSECYFKSKPSC